VVLVFAAVAIAKGLRHGFAESHADGPSHDRRR
jgi:hypothetical protein